jgi:hypothetical protein
MSTRKVPPIRRPRLLAPTAAFTILVGATFAAPAMAMQPVVTDVVAVHSAVLAISDQQQQQQQQQQAELAQAAKPNILRAIDADIALG